LRPARVEKAPGCSGAFSFLQALPVAIEQLLAKSQQWFR
jgi:hypothetical protein